MNQIFEAIDLRLKQAGKILIITHQTPDGDACGSVLSLYLYLKSLDKEVAIFDVDSPPNYFSFLPLLDQFSSDKKIFDSTWDLVVFLDVGDIGHSRVETELIKNIPLINIDHHFTNDNYGEINLVDRQASSTCEVIYDFFKFVGFAIDRRVATCLLTGILNDTGGFANAGTTQKSMVIASELIRKGAKIYAIVSSVTRNKSLNGLRLWGVILSRLKINPDFNLAYTYIKDEDYKYFQIPQEETDGLVNFLSVITEVDAVMLLKLEQEKTRVSMRTTKDFIDVSRLAGLFGGGGHKKAAGFTVPWQVIEKNGGLVVNE